MDLELLKLLSSLNTKLVIGVAGTFASGKDTMADYLVKKFGFKHFSTGDMVRRIAMEKFNSIERPILHQTAELLRRENGPSIFVDLLLEEIQKMSGLKLVINGIRSIGESRAIQDGGGHIIFVDAPVSVRYERMKTRMRDQEVKLSFEQFVANEKKELYQGDDPADFNILGIGEESDYKIINDGDMDEYMSKIELTLLEILRKAGKDA